MWRTVTREEGLIDYDEVERLAVENKPKLIVAGASAYPRIIDFKRFREIADATEVLQFYTSVMRGEVLDQFGIEASLDTRIKAANEIAKHKIELPMKLEQKNITNNIGSIQLNFLPRKTEEIIEMSNKISD